MITYHCDFCKKVLKRMELMEVEVGTHYETQNTYELCPECFKAIKEFIEKSITI